MGWTLVTGGSKKLGREISLSLAKLGHSLLIHYYSDESAANETASLCRAEGVLVEMIQGDFENPSIVKEIIHKIQLDYRDIHYIVNNVGNYYIGSALDTDPQEFRRLFETNLFVPFQLIQAFRSSLVEGKGSVLNIGVAGLNRNVGDIYSAAYTAAKGALLHITRSCAKELVTEGVSVNMLSPGYLEESVDLPNNAAVISYDEAVAAVKFLFDPKNRSITGQNLEIAAAVRL